MTFPSPSNSRIWVRGRFVDLGKAARQDEDQGMRLPARFDPSPGVLLDRNTDQILSTGPFWVQPARQDGYFAILLPATDDPEINPTDWTYAVTEPDGRSYHMVVPLATPLLDAVGDPLHGQRVIDLIDVVPAGAASAGTVQLIAGRGIASMVIDVLGDLIVTYTDGVTANLGLVGTTALGEQVAEHETRLDAVPAAIEAAVVAHVDDATPHPAYDDLPSFALQFENGLL
jgi:hypothetical protein